MLRLSLFLTLLTHRIHTAHVTDRPPHINQFDRIYEKLEKLANAPGLGPTPEEKLYEKLDQLNSLSPDRLDLTEEDEELLSAMQSWFRGEQMEGVVKDLQRMKEERGGLKDIDQEYGDSDWNDEDSDSSEVEYANDANEEWDPEDSADSSAVVTSKPLVVGISPSAITKSSHSSADRGDENIIAAAETIAATNTRPRIIGSKIISFIPGLNEDQTSVLSLDTTVQRAYRSNSAILSAKEKKSKRHVAMQATFNLMRNGKCQEPQSRWLTIKQLAPAADTQYMPPCVQLHRCAPDAGCCINDSEVRAPVDGNSVSIPIVLHKADGSFNPFMMEFFNHTKCACVSREKLRTARVGRASYSDMQDEEEPTKPERLPRPARKEMVNERQNDWRAPTTQKPAVEKDEEVTAPPQLRRCTCPALFLASMTANEPCSCVCDWPDIMRRRDCQSLARGKENFGLRDRVCVTNGDCTQPSCEFGAYDVQFGKCPMRRYRRIRYHGRGRYQPEKTVVV